MILRKWRAEKPANCAAEGMSRNVFVFLPGAGCCGIMHLLPSTSAREAPSTTLKLRKVEKKSKEGAFASPFIAPIGVAYGIDPVHLGIIFLANMELGYLMPPMGENLFLSSMRFNLPLGRIYKYTLPYIVLITIAVLIITYVPWLTLGLGKILGN